MRTLLGVSALMLFGLSAIAEEKQVEATVSPETVRLDAISKQLVELSAALQSADAVNRLRRLENEVLNLKDSIARLESSFNSIKTDDRRSYYSSLAPASGSVIAAKPVPVTGIVGTLKLVNSFTQNATVSLNGRPYALLAGQTVTVPGMPAGDFTYEVSVEGLGVIQPTLVRKLAASEIFTVFIYPR